MRFVVAFVLAAHGVAHLVGFIAAWQIATLDELPYKTTVLAGRIDLGGTGTRVLGLFWLLAALAFVAAGVSVALQASWALRSTAVIAAASLVMCLVAWPEARIGAAVNIAIVLALAATRRL